MKCLNPYPVKHPKDGVKKTLLVPCGQCALCLHTKRLQWVYRMEEESRFSDITSYVTFTYDDAHLVWGEHAPSLDSNDFSKFLARLKRKLKKYGIHTRYYGNGEYGDNSLRPHYHLNMFFKIENYDENNYLKYLDKIGEIINQLWIKGNICMDTANFATMYYVAKYTTKICGNTPSGSEQPRVLCSKHPYIGSEYLRRNGNWHRKAPRTRDEREDRTITARRYMYSGKYKIPLPRVYRRELYGDQKLTAREFENLANSQILEHLDKYKTATKKLQLYKPTKNYDEEQIKQIEHFLTQFERKLLTTCKDEY